MRQSRVLVLLVLLLCAGVGVAWFLASGSAGDAANGAPISDLPTVPDNSAPLNAEQQPHDNTAPELRDKPDRTTPPRPDREPEPAKGPGSGEWVIMGRFRFAEGLPLDTATFFHGGWINAWVCFRDESREAPSVRDLSPEIDSDGSFRQVCTESELPFELRDGKVPDGRWQVTCMVDADHPSLFDVGEGVSIEQLRGLITPTINGRVIDFGDITLEHADLFGDQWLVTGRIVHVTGRALANSPELMLVVMQEDDSVAESYFNTDTEGRFAATLWDEEKRAGEPTQWVARLLNEADSFYGLSRPGASQRLDIKLPRPQIKGRVADFGEIRIGGALVEVEAEVEGQQAEQLPDGRLKCSSWAGYTSWSGELAMWDGYHSANATIYPSPARTTLWLHEGRYEFDASFWVEDCFYPVQRGIVVARDREVVQLKLKFPRFVTIPIEFEHPENTKLIQTSVSWTAYKGEDEVVHTGYESNMPRFRVPVFPGLVTEVRIESRGFAPVIVSATDKDEKLLVQLTPVPAGVATLNVAVPEFPAELSAHILRATLNVVQVDSSAYSYSSGCKPGEVPVPVPSAGRYRVTLNGGGAYGYAGNVLSGPIEVEVKEGDEVSVTLPAIGPAPWAIPISGYECNVRCAGRSVTLDAQVYVGEGSQTMSVNMATGEQFFLAAPPVALPDGDARLPFELPAPRQAEEYLPVSLNLEARIEVKLSRQGQPVTGFTAGVESNATPGGSRSYMSAAEQGGKVLLWAPPGSATLSVNLGDREFERAIDVRRGELSAVDWQLDAVRVQFDMGLPEEPDSPDSYSDLPAPWTVVRLYENREEECCYLWMDEEALLDPGRYRAVPGYGDPALAVEFDLSDGKDRVVKLPQLPKLKLYTLRLTFDAAFFGDKLFEADIEIFQAAMLTRPDPAGYGMYIQTRSVADGIELIDLPGDTDLVIYGSTWVEEGSSLNTWLLKPLRVRVTGEGQSVTCSWTRGVPTSDDWWGLSAWNVSALPGFYLQLESLQALLPGRQELVFTDGAGKEVAREWIDVPADTEMLEIPATLRATLEAKGLLEPKQPDEMPPDEE